MKMFLKSWTALVMAAGFFAMSCDNTEELEPTNPDDEYDVVLTVKEDSIDSTPDVTYDVTSETGATILAKVTFVNTDGAGMKRLYITSDVQGTGAMTWAPNTTSIDVRADGSIGLENSNSDEFSFEFELPVPDSITVGTIVYTFWTTTGNGDPRELEKRLAVGPGTITIRYGGSNPAAEVKVYSDLKLSAPSADGTSESFVSVLNGEVYSIAPEGNSDPSQEEFDEYISYWDFGYINKTNGGPTLHSTATYPEIAFGEFPEFAASEEEKNNTYFRTSTKTAAEFDAIAVASDLNFITQPTDEFVSNLAEGTIVEFVDQYGKKGMIKVLEAVPGNSPNINFVRIDIKVQP